MANLMSMKGAIRGLVVAGAIAFTIPAAQAGSFYGGSVVGFLGPTLPPFAGGPGTVVKPKPGGVVFFGPFNYGGLTGRYWTVTNWYGQTFGLFWGRPSSPYAP